MAPFAFVVWVVALRGPFAKLPGCQSAYGSLVLAFFTVLAPVAAYMLQRLIGSRLAKKKGSQPTPVHG